MRMAQKMSTLSGVLPEWNLSNEMQKAKDGVPLNLSSIFLATPMEFLLQKRGLDAKTLHQYFKFAPMYDGSILKFVFFAFFLFFCFFCMFVCLFVCLFVCCLFCLLAFLLFFLLNFFHRFAFFVGPQGGMFPFFIFISFSHLSIILPSFKKVPRIISSSKPSQWNNSKKTRF